MMRQFRQRLSEATGEEGSLFKDIDYSDPYFVKFTLFDGNFSDSTQRGFEELTAYRENINTNIDACMDIFNTIDTTLTVRRINRKRRACRLFHQT